MKPTPFPHLSLLAWLDACLLTIWAAIETVTLFVCAMICAAWDTVIRGKSADEQMGDQE